MAYKHIVNDAKRANVWSESEFGRATRTLALEILESRFELAEIEKRLKQADPRAVRRGLELLTGRANTPAARHWLEMHERVKTTRQVVRSVSKLEKLRDL